MKETNADRLRADDILQYVKEYHLENATNISNLPGLVGNTTVDLGYTVGVPMRDGYINELRVHKPKVNVKKSSALFIMIFGGG